MSKKQTVKTDETFCETVKAEAKQNTKGILLVAVNHPNYGNYAFQLALSIKHTSPKTKISIAHDGKGVSHLTPDKLAIFDKVIKIKESILEINGRKQLLRFKAYLYDITPYDETLYLDADILWNPKKSIDEFFKFIPASVNFTMQNRGHISLDASDEQLNSNFSIWVNTLQLKKAYDFKKGKLFNLSSELIYFKKSEEVEAFFKTVKVEYSALKVNHIDFSGGIPDELPFAISMIKTGIYPHVDNWRPIYWEAFDKKRLLNKPTELYSQYFAVSFGGNFQESFIKKFHNNLAQYYCNQFGVQHTFPLIDKRSFIAERHKI